MFRLLCDANPKSYGSSVAALSILSHVPSHRVALAHKITAEILADDHDVDGLLEVDSKSPAAVRQAIEPHDFDAVLVVGNQSNIEVYREKGLPIFFVDLLHWFARNSHRSVWTAAEKCFVQNFPGVQERLCEFGDSLRPEIVGPLIRHPYASKSLRAPHPATVVNLGGAHSTLIEPGRNSDYPQLVLEWIRPLLSELPKPVLLVAGGRAANSVRKPANQLGVGVATLSNSAFMTVLASAEVFVTAPAQGAVFAACYANSDVKMVTLPPQNASQVAQLGVFEDHGVFAGGLNLPALDPSFNISQLHKSEKVATKEVLRSLDRITNPIDSCRISKLLDAALRRAAGRRPDQIDFGRLMGPPGGSTVARHIVNWWAREGGAKR